MLGVTARVITARTAIPEGDRVIVLTQSHVYYRQTNTVHRVEAADLQIIMPCTVR
jgi:hypothetical protein